MIVIVLLTLGFTPVPAQPWQICGDTAMDYTYDQQQAPCQP